MQAEKGWVFKPDGDKWRRVVASPMPKRIFEMRPIRWLLEKGTIVIAAGGGGIPTMYEPGNGKLRRRRSGDRQGFLLRTAGARARGRPLRHGDRRRRCLQRLGQADRAGDPVARRRMRSRPQLPGGSMGPKVAAACHFASITGKRAAIGALKDLPGIVRGIAGTSIVLAAGEPK